MRKKYFFLAFRFLLMFSLFLVFSCKRHENVALNQITSIIEQVRQQYCPDTRISVFNVNASVEDNNIILQGEIFSADAKSELLKKLAELQGYKVEDQIIILPDTTLGENIYGIIRVSVAQLRREPGLDKELISQAIMGSEIRLLKKKSPQSNYWYYCQMEDGYLGWMTRSSFSTGNKNFVKRWREIQKLIVTSIYGQVREKPAENSLPVSDLVRGNKLIKISLVNNWYKVELPDGRQGYVRSDIVEQENLMDKSYPTAEVIIKTALSTLGHPYLWGGTSVKGFDCSGFTQSVFKFNGIKLPRDANMQVEIGKEISIDNDFSNLQPGDLLFFGPRKETIIHVGIYIGENRFIHSDGTVRINSFDPKDENYSEYRHKGLRAVRRILK